MANQLKVAPAVRLKYLEKIFRSKVLTLFLLKSKITPDHINLLKSCRYSVFRSSAVQESIPEKKTPWNTWLGLIYYPALFLSSQMTYLPEESRIIYRSKDKRQEKTFDALDWLAAMTSHIPDQREQMVRYYGFYSNVSRGLRKKENQGALIPQFMKRDENTKPNPDLAQLIKNCPAFLHN